MTACLPLLIFPCKRQVREEVLCVFQCMLSVHTGLHTSHHSQHYVWSAFKDGGSRAYLKMN